MTEHDLIESLNSAMDLTLPGDIHGEELHRQLSIYVNHWIEKDFQKLVNLLYRVDVSETKLKDLLIKNTGTDAGNIIATLIIERQSEKIKSRQQFSRRDNSVDEEEKW